MFNNLDSLVKLLPVIVPIVVFELGLMISALVHILRHKAVRRGSMALWIVLIVLLQIIGPALYFIFGREED